MSAGIDHIIYAAPDLEMGIRKVQELLGVKAMIGGQHLGRGTHNALLGLGSEVYLEIIAPDPKQSGVPRPLWMGVDTITAPKLITWAAKSNDLLNLTAVAAEYNIPLGKISNGSRTQPKGQVLSWRLTEPLVAFMDGLIPFFLDWGNSQHPAVSLPHGGQLLSLEAYHPEPNKVQAAASLFGVELRVGKASHVRLVATIQTGLGIVELQ